MMHKIHLQALGPPAPPQHNYVLIVDDSPTVRKIVELSLQREGYKVHSCVDGLEAMQLLTTPGVRIPDLIVLDIGLPRMDGYEVARRLRSKPQFQRTVIVMLTRRDGIVDRLKGRLAGATVYLTKPFTTQDLLTALAEQLGGQPDDGTPC